MTERAIAALFTAGSIVLIATSSRPAASVPSQTAAASTLPTYDRLLLLEKTSETSANISFGDVNGDGHLDVVLAKGRHWPLVDRVLIGNGHGGVTSAYDLGTASDRSYSGRLVDMNGDGSLDVVISNDTPDAKLVYFNDGKGRFRVGSTYGRAEWETRNATVADVNGDGRPDIVVANRGARSSNYFCLNQGGGSFSGACTELSNYPATTITAADFNRDGLVDLVVPHRDGGQSYVYVAAGHGDFPESRRLAFGPADASIRIAETGDVNGDGLVDIVASDERTGVSIYLSERGGGFSPAVAVGGRTPVPYALTVGDLNRDGRLDIVVGYVEAASAAFFNDGNGRRFAAVRFGDSKGTVYGFAIGDLDEDGVLDIGAARSEAPNVVYFGRERKR